VIVLFGICVNAIEPLKPLKATLINTPQSFKNSVLSKLGKNNVFIGIVPGVLI
jgi:hypothetical protein